MKRRIRLSRRTRLRAKNPERAARRHQVQYGGPEYREFLLPGLCVTCPRGVSTIATELSHAATGGMGMKAPWYTVVPQCSGCHRAMHLRGFKTFLAERNRSVSWLLQQARLFAEDYIRLYGAPPPGAPDLPERTPT